MNRDQTVGLICPAGALIVVGRGLAMRRLPTPRLLMLAAIWIAIFAAGFLVVSLIGGGAHD